MGLLAHALPISYDFPLPIWLPLVLLMVGYTMAGLWVLAQQIRKGA